MFTRDDFPLLKNNPDLIYLDNAATTHKPFAVINAIQSFYAQSNASAYRGHYTLAERATEHLEYVRAYCADFINAQKDEIAFVHSATEAINIVARSWAAYNLSPGDEILISEAEHHANILPWQRLIKESGIVIKWIRVNFDGTIQEHIEELISSKTKLVAISTHSNVLGSVTSDETLKKIIKKSKNVGARVLLDGAQCMPHQSIDIAQVGCDFFVFSGHKMLGPTGVGVLYAKGDVAAQMQPYNLGGGMVGDVGFNDAVWKDFPYKLEAGTISVADIVGFGAALNYLDEIGDMKILANYENELIAYLVGELKKIPEISLLRPYDKVANEHLISFIVENIHSHDMAAYLNLYNIAVRAGNHCAQLLHKKLGISSSLRASVYGYTTHQDIEVFLQRLKAGISELQKFQPTR